MESSLWNSVRIDTRTLKHIDPSQIAAWLIESNGNEDADDFRVRVRGLPRKSSRDSIISLENVQEAIGRAHEFDISSVKMLPSILSCDPAWTGGDETCIWWRQGHYAVLLERYKLDRAAGETHMLTYNKLCYWEKRLNVDAVNIDQGEGTAIYTLAMNDAKTSWVLVSFAGSPNDTAEVKDSEYGNIRAQMYYEANKFCRQGGIIAAQDRDDLPIIMKQLCWTKGTRHKVTAKKMCESKLEIKARVGQSPDVADGFVLLFARPVMERLPENDINNQGERLMIGSGAFQMPDHGSPYDDIETTYRSLYD